MNLFVNKTSQRFTINFIIYTTLFQAAFELISVMAVMTNSALIGMNPEVQKLLPSDMTAVNVVIVFVVVEVRTHTSL